jgi:6-phosphogluconolactonase
MAMIVGLFSTTRSLEAQTKPVWIYVGTYTQKEPHVDGKAEGIYIYEMNPSTGALTYVSTSPKSVNPSYVVVHPNGKWLYAANETADGKVSAFTINRDTRKLGFINAVSSEGNSPCYVSVDQSGKFVMVANYGSGTIALYPINDDGSLKEATSVVTHQGKGPDSRQQGPHAHMIRTGNDSYVYAIDLGIDKVITYKIDNQKLVKTSEYNTIAGSGPRHIDFHKNARWAYVVNELNGSIEACSIDAQTGALKRMQVISTLPAGETRKAGCADIHLTPSGKYLYATNRGEINNIAMYSVDQKSGMLKLIGHQSVKGRTPRSFLIDATGTFLLVANQDSDNIITFKINAENGKLTDTGIETKVPTPVCLRLDVAY